ncbi:helix-turn-helix domain-containing protein [Escherichia coli]
MASARLDAGLTQDDIADRLGIGYEAVFLVERGVEMPPL